jgi:hypothetical protein
MQLSLSVKHLKWNWDCGRGLALDNPPRRIPCRLRRSARHGMCFFTHLVHGALERILRAPNALRPGFKPSKIVGVADLRRHRHRPSLVTPYGSTHPRLDVFTCHSTCHSCHHHHCPAPPCHALQIHAAFGISPADPIILGYASPCYTASVEI